MKQNKSDMKTMDSSDVNQLGLVRKYDYETVQYKGQ